MRSWRPLLSARGTREERVGLNREATSTALKSGGDRGLTGDELLAAAEWRGEPLRGRYLRAADDPASELRRHPLLRSARRPPEHRQLPCRRHCLPLLLLLPR